MSIWASAASLTTGNELRGLAVQFSASLPYPEIPQKDAMRRCRSSWLHSPTRRMAYPHGPVGGFLMTRLGPVWISPPRVHTTIALETREHYNYPEVAKAAERVCSADLLRAQPQGSAWVMHRSPPRRVISDPPRAPVHNPQRRPRPRGSALEKEYYNIRRRKKELTEKSHYGIV